MKLRQYLESEGIKIGVFAKKVAVSEATLHNILSGYDTLLSTAFRIQTATRGNVKILELLPTKKRPSRTTKSRTKNPSTP